MCDQHNVFTYLHKTVAFLITIPKISLVVFNILVNVGVVLTYPILISIGTLLSVPGNAGWCHIVVNKAVTRSHTKQTSRSRIAVIISSARVKKEISDITQTQPANVIHFTMSVRVKLPLHVTAITYAEVSTSDHRSKAMTQRISLPRPGNPSTACLSRRCNYPLTRGGSGCPGRR